MPVDGAQSKTLRWASPHCCILRKFRRIANDARPDTAADPHADATQILFLAATVAAGFGVVPLAAAAAEADASALAFVTDIYAAYKGKDAKGRPLDERSIRRYFEPSLATLIVKDQKAAARRGEVGRLDFDPFIDAQDWEISAFDIAVERREGAPPKAAATVRFTNFDKPVTVRLDLVKLQNDWRIADIAWLRDGKTDSLRKIYPR
jgi:Protein of unknown function (DUF3828)